MPCLYGGSYLRRMIQRVFVLAAIAAFCSCSGSGDSGSMERSWTPPAPGTIVAADSVRIVEDSLNNGFFGARLRVAEGNDGKAAFRYDIEMHYGKAEGKGIIVMPYGGENLRPLLRVQDERTIVMGFIPGELGGGDTSFHPYYRIDGSRVAIKLAPLASYKIQ